MRIGFASLYPPYALSGTADHHGADSADHHRRDCRAALLHAQFTATSMIGMIALAGIIVRNSILLVDFINLEVANGVPFQEAVIRSSAVRAKPIILTALAAMLGALFILDDPIFRGLAISLIFGIMVSTLLTLIFHPGAVLRGVPATAGIDHTLTHLFLASGELARSIAALTPLGHLRYRGTGSESRCKYR